MALWTNKNDVEIAKINSETQKELSKEETNRSIELQKMKSDTIMRVLEVLKDIVKIFLDFNKTK